MFFIDPMYFIIIAPALLLAAWAQWRVKSAYASANQVPALSGMTGAQAARQLLDINNLNDVAIEQVSGKLSDHYDPRSRVLRLSDEVYAGRSLAALGIAAHEAGHALQDAKGYAPLKLRNGLVPMAMVGGNFSTILIFIGVLIMMFAGPKSPVAGGMIIGGIILFGATVLFQLVNLPVEYDASRRAKTVLVEYGIVAQEELAPIKGVLSAAALTYVAATLTAILTLLYYLWRFGLIGGGDE